jgi:hypothetical protein
MTEQQNRKAVYVTVKPARKQIHVETPFNMRFIDQLKKRIPPNNREWDEEARIWKINDLYERTIRNMIREYYPDTPAYLLEGAVTTNLHTGETVQQETLFNE